MDISIVNIPASAKVDLEEWARITVETFQFKLAYYNLISYRHRSNSDEPTPEQLLSSFEQHVTAQADGNQALISIAFNYYLRMLDMGVGAGTHFGDFNDTNRKPKPVYSKPLYAELQRLAELLAKQYAIQGAVMIVDEFKWDNGQ